MTIKDQKKFDNQKSKFEKKLNTNTKSLRLNPYKFFSARNVPPIKELEYSEPYISSKNNPKYQQFIFELNSFMTKIKPIHEEIRSNTTDISTLLH